MFISELCLLFLGESLNPRISLSRGPLLVLLEAVSNSAEGECYAHTLASQVNCMTGVILRSVANEVGPTIRYVSDYSYNRRGE